MVWSYSLPSLLIAAGSQLNLVDAVAADSICNAKASNIISTVHPELTLGHE